MAKCYVTVPQIVEAERFLGQPVFGISDIRHDPMYGRSPIQLYIQSKEGMKIALLNDYVVKLPDGEFAVLETTVFERTYKPTDKVMKVNLETSG